MTPSQQVRLKQLEHIERACPDFRKVFERELAELRRLRAAARDGTPTAILPLSVARSPRAALRLSGAR